MAETGLVKTETVVASYPTYEKVVCEVWLDDEEWCLLSQEAGELEVEFYPRRDGKPWKLSYAEAISALGRAKAHLLCEPAEP